MVAAPPPLTQRLFSVGGGSSTYSGIAHSDALRFAIERSDPSRAPRRARVTPYKRPSLKAFPAPSGTVLSFRT